MAVEVEIWKQDLVENLYPNNEFYLQSMDDSAFLIGAKTIHIPQAGAKPGVKKNRTQLPANVSQRTDSDVTYDIAEFSTDPSLLRNTEQLEISYDKRQSILRNHRESIRQDVAEDFALTWAPTNGDNIIRTSGASRNAYRGSGTRNAVSKSDLIRLRRLMNKDDIPMNDRNLLIPADLEADILEISDFMEAQKYGQSNIPDGAIARVYGFNIYIRSVGLVYDDSTPPQPKALDSAEAGTDNLGILAWQSQHVTRAFGDVDLLVTEDDPTYYADILSALARAGGRKVREDDKGVYALVEDQ